MQSNKTEQKSVLTCRECLQGRMTLSCKERKKKRKEINSVNINFLTSTHQGTLVVFRLDKLNCLDIIII